MFPLQYYHTEKEGGDVCYNTKQVFFLAVSVGVEVVRTEDHQPMILEVYLFLTLLIARFLVVPSSSFFNFFVFQIFEFFSIKKKLQSCKITFISLTVINE